MSSGYSASVRFHDVMKLGILMSFWNIQCGTKAD